MPSVVLVLIFAFLQTLHIPAISPAIDRIGLQVFDIYQRISPREKGDAAVRVVDIDDETITRYGQWPWPRTDMARLALALGEAGSSAVAFDIVFSEADRTSPRQLAQRFDDDPEAVRVLGALPDNDEQLATVLAFTPSVMGYFLTHGPLQSQAEPKAGLVLLGSEPTSMANFSNALQPLPELVEPAAGAGFLSIEPDSDGIIRRTPLAAFQNDQMLPSLAIEALRVAQETDSIAIRSTDASGEGGAPGDVVSVRIGEVDVPTNESGEMWMHYTSDAHVRTVPAWRILSGDLTPDQMREEFAGTVVFIGASAIGLRDLRSTPVSDRVPGVMLHALAAEQMILGKFLLRPDWALGLERALLLILGIGLAFALPWLGAARGAIFSIVALGAVGAGSWLAFVQYGYLLDPTWPSLALLVTYGLGTVLVYYREERQRAYIHTAFDRYLAPELVKRIADDPTQLELGGEERDMSVMFCDVRSFSRISETLTPDEIIRFLIALLTPLTDILLERRATIDKYIGDAILAFWNAPLDDPNHHRNAAQAALLMIERLDQLNRNPPQQEKAPWPGDVKIGIGLNSGLCCVGNMGSEQRLSYSLIGDTVNMASRIEGLTKFYGVQIALGPAMQQQLAGFAIIRLDHVRVVGREQPETIYALLGDEALGSAGDFLEFRAAHEAMLKAYCDRNWGEAQKLLAKNLQKANSYHLNQLYDLYAERITEFEISDPGSSWDGVYEAQSK